jgi:hypothetical protein
MKQSIFLYLIILLVIAPGHSEAQVLPNFGGERAGLSALSFLKNDMSTRSSGMGGASVSLDGDAYSIINNPAALTDLESNSYALSSYFLGGGVNQSYAGAIFPLKNKVSNFAISANTLNSGEMVERTEFQPLGTGRTVSVTNLALGLTYSRKLSDLFSAGVTLKYVYEGVAGFNNHTATVDVAFLYKTDFKDLKFAVMVQNFGGNSALGSDSDLPVVFNRNTGIALESNTVPTVFSLGASFVPWKTDKQSLLAAVQLNHPNDNAENYRLGLEYQFDDLVFARVGYKISVVDQDYPTVGFGVRSRMGGHPFYIDYSINPTNHIGVQHNIGLRLSINNEGR